MTNVPIKRETIYCQCFDPSHWMMLHLRDEDDEWDEYRSVELYFGHQYLPFWQRIKELWGLVRHGQYGYAYMALTEHQVRQLREALEQLEDRS